MTHVIPLDQLAPDATRPASDSSVSQATDPLTTHSPATIAALYAHIPFCFHKCHYCDFYSLVEPANSPHDRQKQFTHRLTSELHWRAAQTDLRPRTLFIGGGTPTLLRPPLWESLLDTLHQTRITQNVQEFTVEANPETVTPNLMTLLATAGVNRVSIGAQSFDPHLLHALERWHDPANVAHAVHTVRTAGISNINLDLIFAIPGQTLDTLHADLHAALALEPDHISFYNLTYEPNTPMTARLKNGAITPVPEHLEQQMYEYLLDELEAAGYEHYEVSNWAKPSRRCKHNLSYWTNDNWLGVGPAAASHVNGHRWKNAPHLGRYLASQDQPPTADHEHLPTARSVGEQLMLRLRLIDGVPHTWLDDHLPHDDPRHGAITRFTSAELLERTDTHLRLTRRGLFVADALIQELL